MISNSALIPNYEEKKNNNDTNNVKCSLKELIPTLRKDYFIYKKNNIIKPNHLNKNEMNQKSLEANSINKKNNDLNETKYLFGISTYDENFEKRIVVFELKSKLKIYLRSIKSSDIVHTKNFCIHQNSLTPIAG